MIRFENIEVHGWRAAIRGLRNPLNSWERSDSYETHIEDAQTEQEAEFEPCTPSGIMHILKENDIPIAGQNVCIVGRSNIVGKPLAHMMMAQDATVTVCHSKTRDLAEHTRQADILVSAVGKAGLITADMVKPGAVVIDVGINRNSEGKLCGDVDFDAVKEVAGAITPVPGGVGLMTRAMLLNNVLLYAHLYAPREQQ